MSGATSAQTQLQEEDLQTLQQYNDEQKQQYDKQSALYNEVTSVLDPILKAGANQQGYSQAELNTLNAQAVEGTAENYASAGKAMNEQLAAEGGGNSAITTGGQAQLKAATLQSAAQEESKQESEIQEKNYETGRSNFQNAEAGELAVASGENPTSYEQAATGQANATANEANTIASENDSWISAALGAAGSIGSTAITKWG
jgi:hypothetical protein